MNWASWAIWGFAATIVLSVILSASQGMKLTRMNIPFMLGMMLTSSRDQAKWSGIFVHLINGWIFSLIYVAAFHAWGQATWLNGALVGLVHALFVLTVALPSLPGIHPRMSSEHFGPPAARQLEPPGFFAMNYGFPTPISVVVAHIIFGMILGGFYEL